MSHGRCQRMDVLTWMYFEGRVGLLWTDTVEGRELESQRQPRQGFSDLGLKGRETEFPMSILFLSRLKLWVMTSRLPKVWRAPVFC